MRIVPVNDPRPGQRLQCALCFEMIEADRAVADLDGKAFEAYYHDPKCRPDRFEMRTRGVVSDFHEPQASEGVKP